VGRLWLLPLDQVLVSVAPRVPAVLRRIAPSDEAALACAMGDGDGGQVAARLRSGRRAYGAWVNGQLACYGWASFVEEAIGEHQLRIHLLPGEAYLWDFATLPPHRRQGLYSALLGCALRDLQAGGLRRAWIGADLDNTPSHLGIERAGFRPVANLVAAQTSSGRRLSVEGLPGVPAEWVSAACWALLGRRAPEAQAAAANEPDDRQD
jgi:ribosomal protein S18 acetylase RimI-like enzyme